MSLAKNAHQLTTKDTDQPRAIGIPHVTSWCGPCKMLSPLLEGVSEEGADVPAGSQPVDLVTVNTDVEIELAREFNVRACLSP